MKVRIRCQHCGEYSIVEGMGDNCVCSHCKRYIRSISEYMLKQMQGGENVRKDR